MSRDGPIFNDDDALFASYWQRRLRPDSANDTLERPVAAELFGDPAGHDVLDLGCGDGRFGKYLLAAGANSYWGIDGSEKMIAAATAMLQGTAASVQRTRLQVTALRESSTRPEHFTDEALFRRRQRIPLFLVMAARKAPHAAD